MRFRLGRMGSMLMIADNKEDEEIIEKLFSRLVNNDKQCYAMLLNEQKDLQLEVINIVVRRSNYEI